MPGRTRTNLVARVAEQGIRRDRAGTEALGDRAQHDVAGLVPEELVDDLQTVDVEEDDGERRLGGPRLGLGLLEAREELPPGRAPVIGSISPRRFRTSLLRRQNALLVNFTHALEKRIIVLGRARRALWICSLSIHVPLKLPRSQTHHAPSRRSICAW